MYLRAVNMSRKNKKIADFSRDGFFALLGETEVLDLCNNAFIASGESTLVQTNAGSYDPNTKVGPQGVGEPKYVSGKNSHGYAVYFENVGTATAAAQEVTITDKLGTATVDLDTFSLGIISFGSNFVKPPAGLTGYSTEVDLRPDKNVIVRINATLDKDAGLATWHFVAVDPDTNEFPEDLSLGVLPPNVTSPEGQGSVFFTVMPKDGLATGTEIKNKASIVFDVNEAIETNEWLNTIDNNKPSSHVLPLDAVQPPTTFTVQWEGTDEGSGIQDYTLYVSTDGGTYTAWMTNETGTSTTITGQPGTTYAFYTIASDNTGNTEDAPNDADAITMISEDAVVPTPTPSPEPSPTPVIIPTPTPEPSPTEPPTAVELVIFKARVNDDGSVTLKWRTATEVDNAGFNIYRASSKDGNYTKINNTLIAAKGLGNN